MVFVELDLDKYESLNRIDDLVNKIYSIPNVVYSNNKFYIQEVVNEVVKETYLLSWDVIKTKFPGLLTRYNNIREEVVNHILAHVATEVKCIRKCVAESTGSISPTSDYDITVSGHLAPQIVKNFNETFRRLFHVESGILFDTNLYGIGFYHNIPTSNYEFQRKPKCTPKCEDSVYYMKFTEENADDIVIQRLYALTKFIIHFKKYNLLKINDKIAFDRFEMHRDLINKLLERHNLTEKNLKDIKWMNIQYERKLEEVFKYKKIFEDKDTQSSTEAINYKSKISETNLFANESYFSQGAFLHVVGNMQAEFYFELSIQQYIDSAIENAGDTLKEFNLFAKEERKDAIQNFIIHVSKYIHRFLDATTYIYKKKGLKDALKVNKDFYSIFDKFIQLKKDIKKKSENEVNSIRNKLTNNLLKLLKQYNLNIDTVTEITESLFTMIFNPFFEYIYASSLYKEVNKIEEKLFNIDKRSIPGNLIEDKFRIKKSNLKHSQSFLSSFRDSVSLKPASFRSSVSLKPGSFRDSVPLKPASLRNSRLRDSTSEPFLSVSKTNKKKKNKSESRLLDTIKGSKDNLNTSSSESVIELP